MAQSAPSDAALTVSYSSPTNAPFSTTASIPVSSTLDVAGKSKYLESLRASIATAQDQINKELTARMEEDKAREEAAGAAHPVDDEKEEENYGEEVQGEDD